MNAPCHHQPINPSNELVHIKSDAVFLRYCEERLLAVAVPGGGGIAVLSISRGMTLRSHSFGSWERCQ
jgi:hypothetical protein